MATHPSNWRTKAEEELLRVDICRDHGPPHHRIVARRNLLVHARSANLQLESAAVAVESPRVASTLAESTSSPMDVALDSRLRDFGNEVAGYGSR